MINFNRMRNLISFIKYVMRLSLIYLVALKEEHGLGEFCGNLHFVLIRLGNALLGRNVDFIGLTRKFQTKLTEKRWQNSTASVMSLLSSSGSGSRWMREMIPEKFGCRLASSCTIYKIVIAFIEIILPKLNCYLPIKINNSRKIALFSRIRDW